ncbi:MAG: hypothetical protein C3F08_00455 [Candidatus Methylomirabilota bacterium]|nr:MAG: hypothetical protein C3F08_00455 [candidate division NC10 bacterium]
MKLLQLYNQYRSLFGGEETVVKRTAELMEKHGGEARLILRSSRGLDRSPLGRAQAFVSGVFNPFSYREVAEYVKGYLPDVAHVHNLYPLFSPSVLVALRRAGVPVVMTVHNHFHTCPTANHLCKGRICERCVGGREYHCVLQDCRGNLFESVGYALRSMTARKLRLFTDNVTMVIALNQFAKERLVKAGFDEERVVVLPNMVEVPETPIDASRGRYVVFSGRMCPEKGVATLLDAARRTPEIPIRLLGGGPTLEEYSADAPPNATFLGQITGERVVEQYRGARFLVVPSLWFEGCPLVILEAMSNGLPVIASRIGGLPELVDDGVTGLLFEPGDAEELANKMRALWLDTATCRKMGQAGRGRALKEHSESVFWNRLQAIYDAAIRGQSAVSVEIGRIDARRLIDP